MMTRNVAVLGLMMTLSSFAALADGPAPRVVNLLPRHVFAPQGWDDNDNVQLVVDGFYNNTCYKAGAISHHLDLAERVVRISVPAYVDRFNCLEILNPYTVPVDLGQVPAGEYRIVVETDEGFIPNVKFGTLKVAPATQTSTDDHLYAPVRDVAVLENRGEHPTILLSGTFTNTCMTLKEVKVIAEADVVVVLPIAELKAPEAGKTCEPTNTIFRKMVDFNQALEGTHLIHTRAMNGKSVNTVTDFFAR